ncbi:MAG: hypothetical protein K9N10_07910 [Deltaproteobacteria bacterium]|nr:hypothetical protein [Deltaproteobacteria bacterium]
MEHVRVKRTFIRHAVFALIFAFFQFFLADVLFAFQIGDRVKATENLKVRNCTFLWCDVMGVISSGGTGRIINGSYSGDNYTWWYIGWDNGVTGYSVQDYLAVIPGTFNLSYETPVCDTNPPGPSPAVRLNWTSSSNATYYDVYRNGSLYSPSNTGNTFYNSANVTAGQTYSYYIKARNSSGSQNSNTVSVSIPSNICDSATKPGSFTLNQPSTSCNGTTPQISLSWSSSSNATNYKIYRNGSYYDDAYTSLTYNNTSVSSGTTYSYFIRASNATGYRDSNTLTATAPKCVADPQITIGPSSLSFGSVQVGSCSSAEFAIQHISNTGAASGSVSTSANPPFRVTSNGSFSLSDGQAVNVGVEFCPTSSGSFSGTAVISSNAAQNINSVSLSGTGSVPSPTTGAIEINAKLDGVSWSGSVNYSVSGAQNFTGNSVPADFQDRPQGNYTLAYVSGGPADATFSSITPSSSQTLNGGGVITFTLNFTKQTSNQSPEAKFTMTSGGQTAYENQTLNLPVSSGGTTQVSFSGSRSSDPDGSISSYLWTINGAQVSTSRDFSSSLGKGTHQIYLTVSDNKGAVGSVGANIVIEETTTSTTSTSTTTSTTSTTSIATSTISTTSTPTSTTSSTTTTLPASSTITTLSVPCVKKGELSSATSQDIYKFTLSSQSDVTVSLISTDFDTYLILRNVAGTITETNNDSDAFDQEVTGHSTNSQISLEGVSADIYVIGVSSLGGSGKYTLVIRDIGDAGVERVCSKIGEQFPAIFPGPRWPGDLNDWVVEPKKITDTVTDEGRCVGRCGTGCPGDGPWKYDCGGEYRYTVDCLNHDACCDYYEKNYDHIEVGEGKDTNQCKQIDEQCMNDCLPPTKSCAGPQYVNLSGTCAGQTPCYTTIQSAIDTGGDGSTIRISTGIYSEHLTTTPKTMILWGGWDDTSTNSTTSTSTNSSTSTVNSLTVTDGKIIVENLVIQ